jgi:hypothetical protein
MFVPGVVELNKVSESRPVADLAAAESLKQSTVSAHKNGIVT